MTDQAPAPGSTGGPAVSSSPRRGGTAVTAIATIVVSLVIGALVAIAGSDGGEQLGGLPVLVWCALAALAINWLAWVPASLLRTERFYDLTGTLSYLTVVVIALAAGSASSTAVVLAVLIGMWALRLGTFLVVRIREDGHDGRFDTIKVDPLKFLVSWTMQALWVVLTAGAALAAMTAVDDPGVGVLTALGLLVWVVGFTFEVVADAQKRAFRKDPSNRGRFISSGLWAWSRHPNYFGEITLWVGIAIIALPVLSGWQYVTLVSPVFVAVLLTRISGVPLLEARGRRAWGDDPEYRSYVERTPVLVPRPVTAR